MRLRTFIALFSYQNFRSLSILLSSPYSSSRPLTRLRNNPLDPDIVHRCAGLSPARPTPFYFPFSLDFTHLFVEYLSRNRVSQSYKNPCARLAE